MYFLLNNTKTRGDMPIFRLDFSNQPNDIWDAVALNGCLGIYVVDSVCGRFTLSLCFLHCFSLKFSNASTHTSICLKPNMLAGV